jgi:hypothetical protein
MVIKVLLVSLFAAACGGQILGGDAGPSGGDGSTPGSDGSTHPPPGVDASPPPPPSSDAAPPPLCSPMSGGGTTSTNGDCTVNESWSCGATKYAVDCSCPAKQCTCSQYTSNGGSGTTVPYYNGCPSCAYSGQQLAQLCGFPSN